MTCLSELYFNQEEIGCWCPNYHSIDVVITMYVFKKATKPKIHFLIVEFWTVELIFKQMHFLHFFSGRGKEAFAIYFVL